MKTMKPVQRKKKSTVKDAVRRMLDRLPDDTTLEDIQYHIYVQQKIERGIADIDAGRVVSQKEAERRIAEWVKLYGPKPR